jgi:adenylate cyclase
MKAKKFLPLTNKVNRIIIASLIIGIGGITFYFAQSLFFTIDRTTRDNLSQQGEILYTSIENFMLPGEAELAVSFFREIGETTPEYTITLFRKSGERAFSDNTTVMQVNENLGSEIFTPRQEQVFQEVEVITPYFDNAVSIPPREVFFETRQEGEVFIRIYKPLINLPKCTNCHGSDHTIRGVIDIKANVTEASLTQRNSLIISGTLLAALVGILSVILTQFLKRSIISPVRSIRDVCIRVTDGKFDKKTEIEKNDEIGELAKTVNTMVDGLYERFALSKYVSSSTIKNLASGGEGSRSELTILFTDIRGFTSYSEHNPAETVITHLNSILNVQTEIIHEYGGDVDKYVGDEIVAIFSGNQAAFKACAAAARIQQEIEQHTTEKYGSLRVGIGINSGEVILGMIGSERRADFTVIGDTVNSASRLCSTAKMGEVLISEAVHQAVTDTIHAEGPYKLKVKGKDRYLRVYRLRSVNTKGLHTAAANEGDGIDD